MICDKVGLHNIAEMVPAADGNGFNFCRIPNALRLAINKDAALSPAGSELRFNLTGGRAFLTLQRFKLDGPPELAEVWCGCFFHSRLVVMSKPTTFEISYPGNIDNLERISRKSNLPFDARLIRVLLPYVSQPRLIALEGNMTPPLVGQTPKYRYLAYGSSITQGCTVLHPSNVFPALIARKLGFDAINLGFCSSGMYEPEMTDYLAGRKDWDVMSFEMANIVGLEETEFVKRVTYCLRSISGRHPRKPIFCIDFIAQAHDFSETRQKFRRHKGGKIPGILARRPLVRQIIAGLNRPNIIYVNGLRLLKSPAGLTTDLLHPSDAGMEEIALNLARIFRSKFGRAKRMSVVKTTRRSNGL